MVIDLHAGVCPMPISGPTSVGTGVSHEKMIELSQPIDTPNEHVGTEFKPADQLYKQIRAEEVTA